MASGVEQLYGRVHVYLWNLLIFSEPGVRIRPIDSERWSYC